MAQEVRKDSLGSDENSGTDLSSTDGEELSGSATSEEAEEPQNRRARRAAASQARKHRMQERQEAEVVGLDAQEMLDDAFVRSSDKMGKWFRNNSSLLQGVFVAGLVAWGGWGLYGWRVAKAQESASHALLVGIDAERGKIGDPAEQGKENAQKVIDPTPIFVDQAARLKAADEALAQAAVLQDSSGASAYARLARASVLLDSGKAPEALASFEELKRAAHASADPEFRGRAIEGVALAHEAKGDKAAALKAYQELENTDIVGFKELALYQQARLQRDLGQPDAAKEALKKLKAKLGSSAADPLGFSAGYLQRGLQSLSDELGVDTSAAAAPISADQLQMLQKQLQQQLPAAPAGTAAAPSSAPSP